MDSKIEIPRKAIYRLSIYSRCLGRLHEKGVETVSSSALASAAGVKSAQLRKDIGYLGQFGTRGLGYPVKSLQETIRKALGHARFQPVVLVGAGNLGRALLRYDGFRKEGFEIMAAFDRQHDKLDLSKIPVPVYSDTELTRYIGENNVRMAILCVPAEYGQAVANTLVAAGVQGILNFSPTILQVPTGVTVTRVDLALELENLSFFISQ